MGMINVPSGERDLLDRLSERRAIADDVAPVRELFKRLGVLEEVAQMVTNHAGQAIEQLSVIQDSEMREGLLEYSRKLIGAAEATTPAGQ